jgi:transcriptional regulator with PAS, ATPase and Fis domain
MPFRVALVGAVDSRSSRLLAHLSQVLHPLPCRDWAELAAVRTKFSPELVVVFPGFEAMPPFPLSVPLLALEPSDLEGPADRVEAKILGYSGQAGRPGPQFRLVGDSPVMARVRGALVTTAKSPLPLLLTGENGTGKDLAATIVHELSARSGKPLIVVNCGAIPSGLAETEFFGCVRGAFTGAEDRLGFCQQAWGGTLFLDEIGELQPEIQSKLLRVLENKEVRRVGSGKMETTDFRLICATNRNLKAEVKAGQFREDLYYRIDVLPIRMPALREHKEDLPVLAAHFLSSETLGLDRPVSVGRGALAKMSDYDWPGNLRQLRNVLIRAAVLHGVSELGPQHLEWEA